MRGIKILGTGVYTPETKVTNVDLSKFMETDDEWIVTRTGIKSRNYSAEKLNYTMAAAAAKSALENSGTKPEEIDFIIVSSCTPDFYYPNLSCLVQHEIGAVNAAALDVNTACTGFISALDVASRYLMDGDYRKILVVASERLSPHVDFTDRTSCILFGDGAGAAVIEHSEKPLYSYLSAKGDPLKPSTAIPTESPTARIQGKIPKSKSFSTQKQRKSIFRWTERRFINSLSTLWQRRLQKHLKKRVLQ